MTTKGAFDSNFRATHLSSILSSTIAKYRFFPGDGLAPERPALAVACTSSSCSRCLMDSTGATSGIDNFAIRWPIADGGGLVDRGVIVDGSVRFGRTGFGAGVRVVDLSPSINFLTVSIIFGGGGIAGVGCGDSGIPTNGGGETCGANDF